MTHSNSFVSSAAGGRDHTSPIMQASSRMRVVVWAAMIVLFSSVMLSGTASAQNALINHTIVKSHNTPPPEGRDFWFAMMSNYWGEDLGGKYMRIYITSANNCTAFVASNGNVTPVPVQAYQISSFKIPEFWEMESSGIVENKAIHVYSNTADLTVYDMSHNPYTSDGSYIIPTIGWGTDYVVAAYGSLFEGSGSYVYDLPSTLAVVADQDNTIITITPSADCRQCTSGNDAGDANSTIVVYPQGVPVQFQLNRGQSLQMMPVKAQDCDFYDMTGTIIHANQPIGVSGGSVCPNIPCDHPYCDHVEDMLPPIRTWAETYYTTNPQQPEGSTDDYARYCFISSVPGQEIDRYDYNTGSHVECIISNQYGIYWDELEAAQKFTSAEPFLCVWYINSATYPNGANGNGDPAECIINPKEQYTKTVVFETPQSVGNIVPYDDYANLICRDSDARYTLFDGKGILGLGAQPIDDTFEVFNVPHIAPGTHTVVQDTTKDPTAAGVGVYIYGYGYDESYAWAGSFGTGTFHSPDTISPLADTTGHCFSAYVHVTDSGLLPDGINKQSGLGEIRLDSVYNMSYIPDPNFIEGAGQDSSDYSMYVVDVTKPAILIIDVYDIAGNETKITSVYEPLVDSMKPPLQNLGVWQTGTSPNIAYDTLYNLGVLPLKLDELHLLYGNVGFSIFDSIGGALDLSPIPPGQYRLIQIQFEALVPTKAVDSIIYGNACNPQSVAVIGSGGAADFVVTNQTWPNEPLGYCYPKTVSIENLSKGQITIDSAWWSDTKHFQAVSTFPVTIPASPAKVNFTINYCPDSGSLTMHNSTGGSWFSPQVLKTDGSGQQDPRFDSLTGWAVAPSAVFYQDTTITLDCRKTNDTITATFTIAAKGTSQTTISRVYQTDNVDFFNLQGTLNNNNLTWDPTKTAQVLDTGESATISVQYIVKGQQNGTVIDRLVAFDGNDNIIGDTLQVTINSVYNAGISQPPMTTIGPLQYQTTPAPGANTTSFVIQNTANSPLQIDKIYFLPALYDPAFSFTIATVGSPSVPVDTSTFPYTLAAGQSLQVTVNFNDSLFPDPVQEVQFAINTNSCTPFSEFVTATVTHVSPTTSGFLATPILACDSQTNNIKILNGGPRTETFEDSAKVISVQWIGAAGGKYFSTTLTPNTVFRGTMNFGPGPNGSIIPIAIPIPDTTLVPVTFTPNSGSPGIVPYTDSLEITFVNSDGDTSTQIIPVTGIAGTALVSANSVIANQTHVSDGKSGVVGDAMSMPANVSVMIPPALNGVTVTQLSITGVELTYIIPNRDLLTLTGFQLDGTLSGWLPKKTYETAPGTGLGADTIVYLLTGPTPLTANTTSFGTFMFSVDLDKAGNNTPVTLQSMQLFTGPSGSTPVGACIGNTVSSQDFSLILACGDSTLRTVMNGQGGNISFIGAATPDPVTSGNVTMKYANLGAATMTLAIYDELGNKVARPVNNVYQSAGAWQVTADVSKLPSGTYTYRLSGNSATGPMVVSNQFVIQR